MDSGNYRTSGMVELYVLGLCSDEERAEMDELRRQNSEVNEAIVAYEMQLEAGLQQQGLAPSPTIDAQILSRLSALQTPVVPMPAAKRFSVARALTAAAVLLLTASAVVNYVLWRKLDTVQSSVKAGPANATLNASDYLVMTNPKITPVAMYGVGIHSICRCTMFWDKETGKMYIMIHHLPLSSSQKDYQLWATVNGKAVSVGILNDAIRGRFIELPNVPAAAIAFSVTLEPAGGVAQPTIAETYLKGTI